MYFNKKMLLVTVLAIIIPLMAVGYAALQQKLVISGTSHVDSNWQIEIISVTESDIVGDAKDKVAPSYTGTTAKFKVSLINPTDSITYNIKIKNLGTLDARIKKLNIDIGESDAIIYDVNLVKNDGTTVNLASNNEINQTNINNTKNTTLSPNEEQTVKLKVTFKEGYIGQPDENNSSNTIKMTIDYVQNLKDSNGEQIISDKAYFIGDKVIYKDVKWYVIEDSPSSQDYVALLKEKVLLNAELGTYASNSTYDTAKFHSKSSIYAESYVKEAVEAYAITNNMMDDLVAVEVDGTNYKIRLLTINELNTTLGWTALDKKATDVENNNVPLWIYKDYGENKNGVTGYWLMTRYSENSDGVMRVHSDKSIKNAPVFTTSTAVRPVINLYKSAIKQ